jgi:hypothetical protein
MALNHRRFCAICDSPLSGRRGHGFVTSSGVICGNFKYHDRIKRQQKRKRIQLDNEMEDMLYFEVEVNPRDENLLTEVL